MPRKRLDYIDGLRGMAALMVIVVHCANCLSEGMLPETITHWLKLGRFGVQIFYIISAFTIMLSLDNFTKKAKYKRFYLRRFFRIIPLWWLSIVIMLIYNAMVRGETVSLCNILIHIFCLHGLFPQYITGIVPQGWSVSIEVLFYVFVPFIFKWLGDKLDNYVKLIFSWSLVIWVLNLFGDAIVLNMIDGADEAYFYCWLPNQLVSFLIGICLYLIIIKGKTVEDWKHTSKYMIGIVLVLFLSLSEVLFRSLIIAAVIIILSKYSSKLINNKLFKYVGKISYGVYLSHMLVIFAVQDLGLTNQNAILTLLMYFVAVPVISIILGTLSHYLIEKPTLKLERKIESKVM